MFFIAYNRFVVTSFTNITVPAVSIDGHTHSDGWPQRRHKHNPLVERQVVSVLLPKLPAPSGRILSYTFGGSGVSEATNSFAENECSAAMTSLFTAGTPAAVESLVLPREVAEAPEAPPPAPTLPVEFEFEFPAVIVLPLLPLLASLGADAALLMLP
jgi:hypothetical protein